MIVEDISVTPAVTAEESEQASIDTDSRKPSDDDNSKSDASSKSEDVETSLELQNCFIPKCYKTYVHNNINNYNVPFYYIKLILVLYLTLLSKNFKLLWCLFVIK